jgi:hypothetical protein
MRRLTAWVIVGIVAAIVCGVIGLAGVLLVLDAVHGNPNAQFALKFMGASAGILGVIAAFAWAVAELGQ